MTDFGNVWTRYVINVFWKAFGKVAGALETMVNFWSDKRVFVTGALA